MKVFVPELDQSYTVRGTEIRPGDTAEQRLQKLARIALDEISELVGVLTTEGIVLELNGAALDRGGLTRSDVIGKPFWEIFWWTITPKTQADLREAIARAGKGELVRYEVELYSRKGGVETMILDFTLRPVGDEEGRVVLLVPEGRDITQSKVQERETVRRPEESAERDEAEERFRAFVTASADVVYRMSADWSEMHHLHGNNFIPNTEDLTRNWIEKYVHPDDRGHVLSVIDEAIRTQTPFELEHRVIRADGTLGWTFSRAIPIRNARGEITEWLGAAHDVSERKRAEEALALLRTHSEQQRRLYQTILSSTPDLVYVFDLNHRFVYANEALLTMWGKTAEEALGKNCLELGYEPWHAAMHDREIEQVIATKQPVRGDVPFSGTHGRRIYDYIFVPVIGMNGEVEAIAGTTRDVTERHVAEEKIRDREERLRFMAESMPQKIFTANPEGRVDYFNRQWMEFTGVLFEDIHDWNWMQLVHPDDAAQSLRAWHHSIASGEPFEITHRFRRADGVYRWHLSRAHPMRAPHGKVTMWIGSSTEIQEQKDTEEELRRANQDLEQFAYAATHDLQEPLRSVKIYSDLLAQRHAARLDGQALEFLNYMRGSAIRMEML